MAREAGEHPAYTGQPPQRESSLVEIVSSVEVEIEAPALWVPAFDPRLESLGSLRPLLPHPQSPGSSRVTGSAGL